MATGDRNPTMSRGDARSGVGLAPPTRADVVLAGVVVVIAAIAYCAFAAAADVPRFLLDELNYLDAGTSLAQGDGLQLRGEEWGYGSGYPAVLAGLVALTDDQETTYLLARLLNALAFAAALIPLWLLARRVLETRAALLVLLLTAVIPSTTYVSLVMTESLSYLVVMLACLLMVRAFERPTAARQLSVLIAFVPAVALRTQLVVLPAAWAIGIALRPFLLGRGLRETWREWRVTALVLGLAVVAIGVLTVVGGRSASAGEYDDLLVLFSVREFVVGTVRQLADLTLYLAVIPVVVGAAVLPRWVRASRSGSLTHGALVAILLPLTALLLVQIGVFVASEFEVGALHDRKLFYVIPLWLIVLLDGCRRVAAGERRDAIVGAAAAVGLIALLPYEEIAAEGWLEQHEAPSTELLGHISRVLEPLWIVGVGGAVVLALLAVRLTRGRSWLLPLAVGLVLLANTTSAWRSAFVDESVNGVGPRGTRSWVDRAIGDRARATLLTVGDECVRAGEGSSGLMTLFFNRSVVRSVAVGGLGVARPPVAELAPDGTVVLAGSPLATRYVVTSARVRLDGEVVARGAPADLTLARVPGVVRVLGVDPCG